MPTPIVQMPTDERIFALLVGDSGAGKTSTIPWFPGKKLILDYDRRWKGLLGHKTQLPLEDVSVHQFKGKDIMQETEDLLNEFERLVDRKQSFPYDLIVFDGFTSFDQLVCDQAIEFVGKASAKDKGFNKTFGQVELMGWDAFAYELQCFKNVIQGLKYQLPCSVICTAHWTDRYEEGKVVGRDINLRKKIINQTLLWFDEIYFMEKKTANVLTQKGDAKVETKHTVHFRNDLARTTFPLLPDSADITGKDFYKLLMSGKRGEVIV